MVEHLLTLLVLPKIAIVSFKVPPPTNDLLLDTDVEESQEDNT